MTELIQALTRAANAVAAYYEKQAYPITASLTAAASAAVDAPAEPPKVRKPRAAKLTEAQKDDISGGAPASNPLPVAPTATKDLSEDDSILEVRNIAKTYAKRFANQLDGVAAFRKLMADTCKVGKMDDLVHAQRLQLIGVVKAEIAKADKPAGVLTGAAGVMSGAGVEV